MDLIYWQPLPCLPPASPVSQWYTYSPTYAYFALGKTFVLQDYGVLTLVFAKFSKKTHQMGLICTQIKEHLVTGKNPRYTKSSTQDKSCVSGNHIIENCIMQGLDEHRNKTYPCKGCAQNCLENEGFQKNVTKKCSHGAIKVICLQIKLKLTLNVRFWHYSAYSQNTKISIGT